MDEDSLNPDRRRRTYTRQFKAQMVAQCLQEDVSLASLAVEHVMNPNVLHRWVTGHERYGQHCLSDDDLAPHKQTALTVSAPQAATPFISVPFSAPSQPVNDESIHLKLKRGAGAGTALARVVAVFGAAQPHHAYCFANWRANRMKVLVHDGIGLWLAARRLNRGRFVWADVFNGPHVKLDTAQWHALVLGLPWQHIGSAGTISVL